MRLLIDNELSTIVAEKLKQAGHDGMYKTWSDDERWEI